MHVFRRFARLGMWSYFAVVGLGMLIVSLIAGDPRIAIFSAVVLFLVAFRVARSYRDGWDD